MARKLSEHYRFLSCFEINEHLPAIAVENFRRSLIQAKRLIGNRVIGQNFIVQILHDDIFGSRFWEFVHKSYCSR